MSRVARGAALVLCLICGTARATPSAMPPAPRTAIPPVLPISSPMTPDVPPDPFEPGPARTDTVHKATVSGASLMLVTIVSFNRDCGPGDPVQLRVLTPPTHGEIVIRQIRASPKHPRNVLGTDCSGTELPATAVYYRSANGFTGYDATELRRFSSDGHVRTMHFDISVQ